MFDLSLIIPVYNEGGKVIKDVASAYEVLKSNSFSGEIIIVDDGSEGEFYDVEKECKSFCDNEITVKYIRLSEHRGKGFAVRRGILESRGSFAAFSDCGNCIDYSNLIKGVELIKAHECDIAHASRHIAGSRILRSQSFKRRLSGILFRLYLKLFIRAAYQLSDTQCGFKIYRGQTGREIYAESECNGFLFDIEVIMIAYRKGVKIREFAVEWTCDRDSRLKPCADFLSIMKELKDIKSRFG